MPRLPAPASSEEAGRLSPSGAFRGGLHFTARTSKRSLLDSGLEELLQQDRELEQRRLLLQEAQKEHEQRMASFRGDFWAPDLASVSEASRKRQVHDDEGRTTFSKEGDPLSREARAGEGAPRTETLRRSGPCQPRDSLASNEGRRAFAPSAGAGDEASSSEQLARAACSATGVSLQSRAPLALASLPVPSSSSTLPSPASAPPLSSKAAPRIQKFTTASSPSPAEGVRFSAFRSPEGTLPLREGLGRERSFQAAAARAPLPSSSIPSPREASRPSQPSSRGSLSALPPLASDSSVAETSSLRLGLVREPLTTESRASRERHFYEEPTSRCVSFQRPPEDSFSLRGEPLLAREAEASLIPRVGLGQRNYFDEDGDEAELPSSGVAQARRHFLAPPQALRQSALERIADTSKTKPSVRGASRERRGLFGGETSSAFVAESLAAPVPAVVSSSSEGPSRLETTATLFRGKLCEREERPFSTRRECWHLDDHRRRQVESPSPPSGGAESFENPCFSSPSPESPESDLLAERNGRPQERTLCEAAPSPPSQGLVSSSGAQFLTPNPEEPSSASLRFRRNEEARRPLSSIAEASQQAARKSLAPELPVAVSFDDTREPAPLLPPHSAASRLQRGLGFSPDRRAASAIGAARLRGRRSPSQLLATESSGVVPLAEISETSSSRALPAPSASAFLRLAGSSSSLVSSRRDLQKAPLAGEAAGSSSSLILAPAQKGFSSSRAFGFEAFSSSTANEAARLSLKEPRRQPHLREAKQRQSPSPPGSSSALSLARVSLACVSASAQGVSSGERRLTSLSGLAGVCGSSSGMVKPQAVWNVELPAACKCPLPPSHASEGESLVKVASGGGREGTAGGSAASVFLELKRCKRCGRLPLTAISYASSIGLVSNNSSCKRDPAES